MCLAYIARKFVLKAIPKEILKNILNHDSITEMKPPKVITVEKNVQMHRFLCIW